MDGRQRCSALTSRAAAMWATRFGVGARKRKGHWTRGQVKPDAAQQVMLAQGKAPEDAVRHVAALLERG